MSDYVRNYLAHRPRYPNGVVAVLRMACGLTPELVIVDVGSGTGLLAEPFLQNGNPVIGVEPDAEMRDAGDVMLRMYPSFSSMSGRAEQTGLPPACADVVMAGQSWHWFQPQAAAREFKRLLRPDGWVALVWNARRSGGSPFLADYEAVMRTGCPDYPQDAGGAHNPVVLQSLFRSPVHMQMIYNVQVVDEAGFLGRALAASYAPMTHEPAYAPLRAALIACFARHAHDAQVAFEYDCFVYILQPQ